MFKIIRNLLCMLAVLFHPTTQAEGTYTETQRVQTIYHVCTELYPMFVMGLMGADLRGDTNARRWLGEAREQAAKTGGDWAKLLDQIILFAYQDYRQHQLYITEHITQISTQSKIEQYLRQYCLAEFNL